MPRAYYFTRRRECVYFVQAGNGRILIGHTREPEKQFRDLRRRHPELEPLRLLGCLAGKGKETRESLALRFADDRVDPDDGAAAGLNPRRS